MALTHAATETRHKKTSYNLKISYSCACPTGLSPPSNSFHHTMTNILIVFAAFFTLRLCSLAFSIHNEKRLLSLGAVQYGKRNSLLLTLAHIAFYFSSLYEAYATDASFNSSSLIGVGILAFAYAMLFYVIYKLRDVWTLKLYIVPNQRIERSWLFRNVRHPNYFLNIIPELIGVAWLCQAKTTFIVGFPIYCVLLFVRIRQEEKAMKGMLD